MKKKIKIAHLTSVHPRYDTRIFVKECSALAEIENYSVYLIVADEKEDEIVNRVKILSVGKKKGRLKRLVFSPRVVYKKALEIDANIYHIHDPELIPAGLKLKKKGKFVVFDAHEDFPKQLLGKPYLNKYIAKILALLIRLYEKRVFKKFDFIIAATPYIRNKVLKINKNCVDVNNYPIVEEFSGTSVWEDKKDQVCYTGGLTEARGIWEMVESLSYLNTTKLALAGRFFELEFEKKVKTNKSWDKVNELGYLNRKEVALVYKNSKAGLVTLHPLINYLDSLPVKMFEYMAAGIPVIASDIKLWKSIIEENECGVCVNPIDTKSIADAIDYVIKNPNESERMGKNGRQAVLEKFNWNIEKKKLINLYNNILR
ncbi:glycosyltransferase WbpH [Polaribacter pacificus]|uniref:Glycosyltransferase WbpH n=1 Tax=Polaribacter pacificus TaxID=1775173 RepID=A0A917I1K9_9FLAO|nr:glycosyltransferase family 4 protein [Polaribacter pacificus]GGH01652.1 glycosyltransferase WbpH [Polaribacter pacificus]